MLLVGGEYGRQTLDRQQFTGTVPSITLYNPVPDLAPTLNPTSVGEQPVFRADGGVLRAGPDAIGDAVEADGGSALR